jgi:hypothetical protein
MRKRPEHIDEIENFYRDELNELEIEPPQDAWENIHQKLHKPAKPFYKSSGFIVSTVTVLFTGATLLLMQMQQEDNKVIEEFKKEHHLVPETIKENSTKEVNEVKSEKTAVEKVKKSIKNNSTVISPKDTSTKVNAVDNAINEVKSEPVQTETEKPIETKSEKKKPKSFYEKYSEEYKDKDTSRNLFKPSN